jgi:hypothetical protein
VETYEVLVNDLTMMETDDLDLAIRYSQDVAHYYEDAWVGVVESDTREIVYVAQDDHWDGIDDDVVRWWPRSTRDN